MSLVLFRHEFVKADVVDYVIFILVIMKLLFAMIKDEMMRSKEGPGPQAHKIRAEGSTPDHGWTILGSFEAAPPNTLKWTGQV